MGWFVTIIPTIGKLKQKGCHEFQTSLDYRVKFCLKTKSVLIRAIQKQILFLWEGLLCFAQQPFTL